jgi:hypothetical protein
MREAINSAVRIAKGEFIMKMDAHCLIDKGFDEKMTAVCEYNTVIIPRRYRLTFIDINSLISSSLKPSLSNSFTKF